MLHRDGLFGRGGPQGSRDLVRSLVDLIRELKIGGGNAKGRRREPLPEDRIAFPIGNGDL
jgi:hypothetical protein